MAVAWAIAPLAEAGTGSAAEEDRVAAEAMGWLVGMTAATLETVKAGGAMVVAKAAEAAAKGMAMLLAEAVMAVAVAPAMVGMEMAMVAARNHKPTALSAALWSWRLR